MESVKIIKFWHFFCVFVNKVLAIYFLVFIFGGELVNYYINY